MPLFDVTFAASVLIVSLICVMMVFIVSKGSQRCYGRCDSRAEHRYEFGSSPAAKVKPLIII